MVILAIDAGNIESGYVFWNGKTILQKGKVHNNYLIEIIKAQTDEDMPVYIEMIASYGMAVGQTVFDTCVAIGQFKQAAIDNGCNVELIYRREVKMFMCGQVRANDSNIIRAIKDAYGEKGTKKHGFNPVYNDEVVKMNNDIWQAFALALTCYKKT